MTDPRDPETLARERAAQHGIAAGPRNIGLALAMLGLIAAVARATVAPSLPAILPATLIVTALGLIGVGIVRRARYHFSRRKDHRP